MVTEEKLTGRELDNEIAIRVMGWNAEKRGRWFSEAPCYSSDPRAAAQVEDRINDLGLWREYASALLELTGTQYQSSLPVIVWAIVRATPEQKCLAALEAINNA